MTREQALERVRGMRSPCAHVGPCDVCDLDEAALKVLSGLRGIGSAPSDATGEHKLEFTLERGSPDVILFSLGGRRPATAQESALWAALERARAIEPSTQGATSNLGLLDLCAAWERDADEERRVRGYQAMRAYLACVTQLRARIGR